MNTALLPEALRDHGVRVKETTGWRGRGFGPIDLAGQLSHHTAIDGPATDGTAARLIEGRADLSGPLANGFGGIGTDGVFTVWLLAGGQAHHAGRGSSVVLREFLAAVHVELSALQRDLADDTNGNPRLWGWEWQHVGTHPRYADPLLDGIGRCTAAFADLTGLVPNQHKGHKHWTRRKPDPSWPGSLPALTARHLGADMGLSDTDKQWLSALVRTEITKVRNDVGTVAGNQGAADNDRTHGSVGDVLRALESIRGQLTAGGVDVEALAAAVAPKVADVLATRLAQ